MASKMAQRVHNEEKDGSRHKSRGSPSSDVLPDMSSETPTRPQRSPTIADYFRVFTYATKADLFTYFIAVIASLGAGVTLPLMNIIFGQLVGQFTAYFREESLVSQDEFNDLLKRQTLYIMGLFFGRWALNSINKFCFRIIGIRLSSAVRLHYLKALLAQPVQVIDSLATGAPATAITTTANTLQLGISERLGTFLQFNGTIWSALITAFIWSWDLTLVTSALIIYVMTVLAVVLPMILKGQVATLQADTEAIAIASESFDGVRLVMACGAQSKVLGHYGKWVDLAKKRGQAMAPIVGIQFGLIFFGVFGTFGLAFWYGTQRYIDGAIADAGAVIVVLMSVMMILTSLERVSTPLMAVSKAMVAACEFFAVIDAETSPTGTSRPAIDEQDIVFDGITFEYPGRPGVSVLQSLSLVLPAGKNTALVGTSGSGKSTIVGLLQRWYSLRETHVLPAVVQTPTAQKTEKEGECTDDNTAVPRPESRRPNIAGTIRIGTHDLEDLDLRWWRSKIGLVQQEPFLFNDTIYGNVANGLLGTELAEEPESRKRDLVVEACREAYAHDFISKLPDGYDTPVGDGGIKLSGGQKQRIAIARSIVSRPSIIIFDEATSAIDVRSERIVQAALNRVSKGRTTVTIAHRLSTIKNADHIVVLEKGHVTEEGTHQALLDQDGAYAALVKMQTLAFDLAAGDQATSQAPPPVDSDKDFDEESDQGVAFPAVDTDEERQEEQHLSLLASFFSLLYQQRKEWPSYATIVLASAAVAAATPLQAWLFAKVIGVFVLEGDRLSRESDFWGLMWFVLAAGVGLSYTLQGWIGLRTQYAISASYKSSYFSDLLFQRISFFDKDSNSHGSLSSRVSSDAKQLEELLGLNLGFLLSGTFTVTGCIITALVFAWELGLVATFVTMPVMLTAGWWKLYHEIHFDAMNSAVFMESSQFATEAVGAIRTVNALTMEGAIIDRYQQLLDRHVKAATRKARWTAVLFGFTDSASLGCQALVFWYGGSLLARGKYGLEAFFVCFMAAIQGAEAASQALAVGPNAAQAGAASNRILGVRKSADTTSFASRSKGPGRGSDLVQIELRDVSFRYPTRNVQVLNNVSLTIGKGQNVAFVGPSGCGKTTIISLLERFYDVQPGQGAILFNGADINKVNLYEHQANLSLVSQEPMLFRGTVRENILLGVSNPESISEERLHTVCRDAFIHDFITSLPDGYNTDVGQKGVSISGGQKQRIAIARALIRDPDVLLLDEATSALDSESEAIVLAAFEKARRGRTVVTVAHRLATIQHADVIFVFNEGRIVEQGSHDELIRQRGDYWRMCQGQALDH